MKQSINLTVVILLCMAGVVFAQQNQDQNNRQGEKDISLEEYQNLISTELQEARRDRYRGDLEKAKEHEKKVEEYYYTFIQGQLNRALDLRRQNDLKSARDHENLAEQYLRRLNQYIQDIQDSELSSSPPLPPPALVSGSSDSVLETVTPYVPGSTDAIAEAENLLDEEADRRLEEVYEIYEEEQKIAQAVIVNETLRIVEEAKQSADNVKAAGERQRSADEARRAAERLTQEAKNTQVVASNRQNTAQQALREADEAKRIADQAKNATEQAINTAITARDKAVNAQSVADKARQSAEQAKIAADKAQASKASSETARTSAKEAWQAAQDLVSAEKARLAAEKERLAKAKAWLQAEKDRLSYEQGREKLNQAVHAAAAALAARDDAELAIIAAEFAITDAEDAAKKAGQDEALWLANQKGLDEKVQQATTAEQYAQWSAQALTQLAQVELAVADEEGTLTELTNKVAAKDAELADLTNKVAAKDAELASITNTLAEQQAELMGITTAVAEEQNRLEGVNEEVANQLALLEDAKAKLGAAEAELAKVKQEYDELLAQVVEETKVPPPPDPAILPATYTVRTWSSSKDCFWNIAAQPWAYGDGNQWRVLYNANKSKLVDPNTPDLLEPGVVLDIPSIKGETRSGAWDATVSYVTSR
ncbi:MAG: hypothetical protein LBO67_08855 [Spirochaetaceae bacterium]|nr:hypothetical protein [Spirochaetaceae bacterium]